MYYPCIFCQYLHDVMYYVDLRSLPNVFCLMTTHFQSILSALHCVKFQRVKQSHVIVAFDSADVVLAVNFPSCLFATTGDSLRNCYINTFSFFLRVNVTFCVSWRCVDFHVAFSFHAGTVGKG